MNTWPKETVSHLSFSSQDLVHADFLKQTKWNKNEVDVILLVVTIIKIAHVEDPGIQWQFLWFHQINCKTTKM